MVALSLVEDVDVVPREDVHGSVNRVLESLVGLVHGGAALQGHLLLFRRLRGEEIRMELLLEDLVLLVEEVRIHFIVGSQLEQVEVVADLHVLDVIAFHTVDRAGARP